MAHPVTHSSMDWPEVVRRVRDELSALDDAAVQWLQERVQAIECLQEAIDRLFCKADGERCCRDCEGDCCGHGRHHLTLTNLLAFLLPSEEPPTPDFRNSCPYLGVTGCLLPVSRRPYNCITFFCDRLESGLSVEDQKALRDLDRQLRREYLAVAERYPAASLRGVWIAMGQMQDGEQILRRRP